MGVPLFRTTTPLKLAERTTYALPTDDRFVTPPEGADGLSKVTVKPFAAAGTLTITANGTQSVVTQDPSGHKVSYNEVKVSVPNMATWDRIYEGDWAGTGSSTQLLISSIKNYETVAVKVSGGSYLLLGVNQGWGVVGRIGDGHNSGTTDYPEFGTARKFRAVSNSSSSYIEAGLEKSATEQSNPIKIHVKAVYGIKGLPW